MNKVAFLAAFSVLLFSFPPCAFAQGTTHPYVNTLNYQISIHNIRFEFQEYDDTSNPASIKLWANRLLPTCGWGAISSRYDSSQPVFEPDCPSGSGTASPNAQQSLYLVPEGTGGGQTVIARRNYCLYVDSPANLHRVVLDLGALGKYNGISTGGNAFCPLP